MYDPTHASAPPWAHELPLGLSSLRLAADRARTAYEGADAAARVLRSDVAEADSSTDPVTAAHVLYEGYQRTQIPATLGEIAFSHQGLALSLARVWHRAAFAYAYGTSHTLNALARGQQPHTVTISHSQFVPESPSGDEELTALYAEARTRQLSGLTEQPHGDKPWATSAQAWATFGEAAEQKLCDDLAELAELDAPNGR
ncbi:hypothetical protein [Streptomyces sp. NPDC059009]|uniref:hypothetical protein n=1 Tax=Streptomyces sp. NPDC059009 TaxID=3346694 RepID=UPI0036A7345D